jgi:hypothetical protein
MKLLDFLRKPVVAAALGALVGIILGLIWAWQIQPVVWKDVPPSQMGKIYQEDYMRMAIDSYNINSDSALALQRYSALGEAGPVMLATVTSNPGKLEANKISSFANVIKQGGVVQPPSVPSEQTPVKTSSVTAIAIILGAVILFALVGYGILRYLIPLFRNAQPEAPTTSTQLDDITSQPEMTDYQSLGQDSPISQFVTTYVLGDDLFDDSFSIDSPSGEFLGECGIGISETIGVGDPKKVQAFEVWLFDKNDVQTVTKVLMSAHAYNDVAIFQRMQAKGEPFMVERGKQIVLETAALQLVATVSDAAYGQGAMPEQSYFDRLTLEIAVWPKTVSA